MSATGKASTGRLVATRQESPRWPSTVDRGAGARRAGGARSTPTGTASCSSTNGGVVGAPRLSPSGHFAHHHRPPDRRHREIARPPRDRTWVVWGGSWGAEMTEHMLAALDRFAGT